MAAWLNKWLFLSFSGFFLLINQNEPGTKTLNRGFATLHPFHVSVVEINHNAADKTLEISCKIFTDDFEKVLAQNYKTKVDLINPPKKAVMDSLVKKYILSHLQIKADGKLVALNYLGFEIESEAAYCYIEVENIAAVKKLDITSNLMYDLFDDQVNIIHLTIGGKRKSNKMDYPSTNTSISF